MTKEVREGRSPEQDEMGKETCAKVSLRTSTCKTLCDSWLSFEHLASTKARRRLNGAGVAWVASNPLVLSHGSYTTRSSSTNTYVCLERSRKTIWAVVVIKKRR